MVSRNQPILKIKVLFVDHTPIAGGAQLCLASHIKYLDRKAVSPYLIIDRASSFDKIYKQSKVPVFKITFEQLKGIRFNTPGRLAKSLKEFNQLLDKINPDIVVANTTRALIVSSLASKKYKLISYVRDYDYPKWLLKLVQERVDQFWMVSKSVQYFYQTPNQKTEVIYLGSEMQKFLKNVDSEKVKRLRKELELKKGDTVVGFVGRLVEWKGSEVVLDAVAKIPNKKIKLLLFGSGKNQPGDVEEKLLAKIVEYDLEDRVKIVGFVDDRAIIYNLIDIFVLSSRRPEPFATTVIEAALSKKAIIATDIGGTREFIKHNKNGLLVKPGSVLSLSKTISKMSKDLTLRKKLSQQAFKDAQTFDEALFARKLEKMYGEIIR